MGHIKKKSSFDNIANDFTTSGKGESIVDGVEYGKIDSKFKRGKKTFEW